MLEQKIDLLFQKPHFEGNRNFGLTFSGGYANSQDVSTYVASRLEGGMRWTEHFNSPGSRLSKANTFVYEFDFRRVKVAGQQSAGLPRGNQGAVDGGARGGPGVTWIRDTRDSPLDAHRGTYTSFQEFLSSKAFGAQAQFNRLDLSNSSYYSFGKDRFVLARNTRYGQERAFGDPEDQLIPLPERLYAGGPTSLRGFASNAAGPRDPETGYPIGGAGALINSTELRLPPPTLPWFGNTLSFVLFHDMGNVFTNAGDAWASALRIHQPDRETCKILTYGDPNPIPTGPVTSTGQQGECSFNYFSHAPGLGLRYHTPVGPIRLDFSYNLNPPIFPVNIDYSLSDPDSGPHVGQAGTSTSSSAWGKASDEQPAPNSAQKQARPRLPLDHGNRVGRSLSFGPGAEHGPGSSARQFPVVLDRVVAVVNHQAILASDLDDEMRLAVLDPGQGGRGVLTRPRALEQLISRALIQQQIRQEDAQAAEPSQAEVDARLAEIRKELPACVRLNCASDAGWKAFLAAHGLTPERVESYLRYRLEILRFIEKRFRQGIRISPEEIETYYRETLLPQYAAGEAIPPLDKVSSAH